MRGIFRTARATYAVLALLLGTAIAAALLSPIGSASTSAGPSNTALPAISGSAAVGQTVTTSDGTWSPTPTSFTYQWKRCPSSGGAADGSDCAVIGGATANSYVVTTGDVGFTLRALVTAADSGGQTTVASNASPIVATKAGPPNTAPPTITGTASIGSTLTANPGTWTGTSITFTYQWQRCDTAGANCTAISSATSTTYVVANEDVGHTLRVAVTGKDATGSNTVTSAQTSTATGAAPPPTGCPANKSAGPIAVTDVSPPARLLIDKQQSTPRVITATTSTIVLRFHVSACSGRSVTGALVYQTATPYSQFSISEEPTGSDGWATLTLHRGAHFPAATHQGLLVVFVRARKSGEDLLGGISTRRLVSFPVNLKG